ncbi:hypothetical protein Tco_1273952 [Tanacetum coccineum]
MDEISRKRTKSVEIALGGAGSDRFGGGGGGSSECQIDRAADSDRQMQIDRAADSDRQIQIQAERSEQTTMPGDSSNTDSPLLFKQSSYMPPLSSSTNYHSMAQNQIDSLFLSYQKLTAMAETLGHTTSHAVWSALEDTYRHDSLERTHTLRDSLRRLKKGSSTVSDFSSQVKVICVQ